MNLRAAAVFFAASLFVASAFAQSWTGPVRGSWVRESAPQEDDVTLFDGQTICDIECPPGENSAVRQAAQFLAADLEKLTGQKPKRVDHAIPGHVTIHLFTASDDPDHAKWPWSFPAGAWEAFDIRAAGSDVYCAGSDFRGAAFAVYTLSERLGIDPLYHWTGFRPAHHPRLVLRKTNFSSASPTFRYRGFFHDDEDILPRPFENSGYPSRLGDVPTEWYAKYFETALRLRLNMVAPYTRVHRRYEVQKMASDWGLFYTSHHYDLLLSNPFGMQRYGLAEKRHSGAVWDWSSNRAGMSNYWRGGVEENKDLNCIFPVGLRGTDDHSYGFPRGMPESDREKIFADVIKFQVNLVREILPKNKTPLFHFTMYSEMLDRYLKNPAVFDMPRDAIIVWTDDNDGRMRYLPVDKGESKHGVYYHLAYLGPVAKQSAHIVTPAMVAQEFKKITDAGATEYMLVNVSELREFVMEARMISEICWDAKTALAGMPSFPPSIKPLPANPPKDDPRAVAQPISNPAADRYVAWWCREYFGELAAPQAQQGYHDYYTLLNAFDQLWSGSSHVQTDIDLLINKLAGKTVTPPGDLPALNERIKACDAALHNLAAAKDKMSREQSAFFFDHLELPLLMTSRPTEAAALLSIAIAQSDREKAWAFCERALHPLEQLENEIARAEHPPFDLWYRKTWIRRETKDLNVHRPYEQLRLFLSSGGTEKLQDPPGSARPVFPVRKD